MKISRKVNQGKGNVKNLISLLYVKKDIARSETGDRDEEKVVII